MLKKIIFLCLSIFVPIIGFNFKDHKSLFIESSTIAGNLSILGIFTFTELFLGYKLYKYIDTQKEIGKLETRLSKLNEYIKDFGDKKIKVDEFRRYYILMDPSAEIDQKRLPNDIEKLKKECENLAIYFWTFLMLNGYIQYRYFDINNVPYGPPLAFILHKMDYWEKLILNVSDKIFSR